MPLGQGPFRTPSPPEVVPVPRALGAFLLRCARQPHAGVLGLALGLLLVGALVDRDRPLIAVASAGLAASIALGTLAFTRLRGVATVDLHENGLVLRLPREPPRPIAFDDVDLVFVSPSLRVALSPSPIRGGEIALTLHDGDRVTLPSGRHLRPLIEPLELRCSQPLLDPARIALAAGDLAHFGPVTLAREGVRVNGAERSWAEIGRATFDLEHLTFHDADGRVWRAVALSRVPHTTPLAALLADKTHVEHVLPWFFAYFARHE